MRNLISSALGLMAVSIWGCHPPSAAPHSSAAAVQPDDTRLSEKQVTTRPTTEPPIDRSRCGMPQEIRKADWPRHLEPTQDEEPVLAEAGTLTIAVLPDTQYYASCRERHFAEQGKWVASQVGPRNIQGVILLGDLTEHNEPEEWEYLTEGLRPLFDKVPLFLATGNHDHGDGGTANKRASLFASYLGTPQAATLPTVAASMKEGDIENAYYRLPLGKFTLGVLVLEWSPRRTTVAWARQAVAKYPDDRKIFVTHAYLYHDNTRYHFAERGPEQEWNPLTYGSAKKNPELPYSQDNAAPEGAYDGEMLWNELLVDMPGLFLTLNGHVLSDGAGQLSSRNKWGDLVHQVLTNFQMLDEGGLGYLRLVELSPSGTAMRMKTYSPSLQKFATAPEQNFVLPLEPALF